AMDMRLAIDVAHKCGTARAGNDHDAWPSLVNGIVGDLQIRDDLQPRDSPVVQSSGPVGRSGGSSDTGHSKTGPGELERVATRLPQGSGNRLFDPFVGFRGTDRERIAGTAVALRHLTCL